MVKCNMCGKDLNVWDMQQKASLHMQIGYGSKYDGDFLALDLCSDCMDNFIEELSTKCKIPLLHETKTGDL